MVASQFTQAGFVPCCSPKSLQIRVITSREGFVPLLPRSLSCVVSSSHPTMSRITAHLSRRVLLVGGAVWLAILLYMFGGSHILPVLASRLTWNDPQEPSYEGLLPPIFNPHLPGQPPQEFDDEGGCLFLSPFDALSEEEKALARGTVLDEAAPGVVRVNVSSTGEQTHPIPALLLAGEQRWKKLLATQSTTLEEAARTYEERWGRPPPKGFDGWWVLVGECADDRWQFASERSPLLVDEFDS